MDPPLIPVSIGELFDKYSILEIKLDKIIDNCKSTRINNEYNMLTPLIQKYEINQNIYKLLKNINLKLWNIENQLRNKESLEEFDSEFIELARSVYFNNDKRAEIKKTINAMFNSPIYEVKSYTNYQNQ